MENNELTNREKDENYEKVIEKVVNSKKFIEALKEILQSYSDECDESDKGENEC